MSLDKIKLNQKYKDFNKLYEVDLRNRQFNSIEKDIFNGLTNLTRINLAGNLIKSLDKDTFKGLNNLILLNLRWNKLESLDVDVIFSFF
jgi:Leucine-rich repeat (LRR) protein